MLDPLPEDIVLHPKADLYPEVENAVSGKTGAGMDRLVSDVTAILKERSSSIGVATHERHRTALTSALENLKSAQDLMVQGADLYDIAAEELRSSVRSLEGLIGRVGVEDLLDEIFSSFCIGK